MIIRPWMKIRNYFLVFIPAAGKAQNHWLGWVQHFGDWSTIRWSNHPVTKKTFLSSIERFATLVNHENVNWKCDLQTLTTNERATSFRVKCCNSFCSTWKSSCLGVSPPNRIINNKRLMTPKYRVEGSFQLFLYYCHKLEMAMLTVVENSQNMSQSLT